MILQTHDFNDPNRIQDITIHLKYTLNISDGRDLLILLNDTNSQNNLTCLQKWVKARVWNKLASKEKVDIELLGQELLDELNNRRQYT
jgi:hypothetical protein